MHEGNEPRQEQKCKKACPIFLKPYRRFDC